VDQGRTGGDLNVGQTVCVYVRKPESLSVRLPTHGRIRACIRCRLRSYNMFMQAVEGSETVLVVDDEFSVLSLAHAMFRRYGYTVIGANSAAEALRLFKVWHDLEVD